MTKAVLKYSDSLAVGSNIVTMEIYLNSKDLPKDWEDNIGDNLYLKRSFLELIEQIDDSEKSYYVFRTPQGKIDTQFLVSKTIDNNIAMFTPFKIPVILNAVYFPFSLSKPAGIFGNETKGEAAKFLKNLTGFKLIVNVDKNCILEDFARGLICPKLMLSVKWTSFEEYMSSLRSKYRYRYNTALNKSKDLNFYLLKNNKLEFSEEMYNLYLDVYESSAYKLGKAPIDFFRHDDCIIFVLKNEKEGEEGVQGFAQMRKNDEELLFEFVGLNKKNVSKYDTYIRLLVEVVRYGIENGFKTVDCGQTTDDMKIRLGCKYEMLYALISHSNPIINFFLKKLMPWIQYKPLDENQFHVFRTD